MSILTPGFYKLRDGKRRWFAVLLRVENSTDDQGRVADRPRLVLWIGGERHERPDPEVWSSRLWPCSKLEYDRLAGAHDPDTAAKDYDIRTARPLF